LSAKLPIWAYLAPTALLGVALFELPYGYYQFLRIVVTAACASIAVRFNSTGHTFGLILFGFLVVLYNPIVKIHMERETHEVVNIVTAALIAIAWYLQSKHDLENSSDQ
jgi:hypothetical protein